MPEQRKNTGGELVTTFTEKRREQIINEPENVFKEKMRRIRELKSVNRLSITMISTFMLALLLTSIYFKEEIRGVGWNPENDETLQKLDKLKTDQCRYYNETTVASLKENDPKNYERYKRCFLDLPDDTLLIDVPDFVLRQLKDFFENHEREVFASRGKEDEYTFKSCQ